MPTASAVTAAFEDFAGFGDFENSENFEEFECSEDAQLCSIVYMLSRESRGILVISINNQTVNSACIQATLRIDQLQAKIYTSGLDKASFQFAKE